MTESHDHETEARIRAALDARADATVVSADALEKIRASQPSSPWARPMVYAAVAGVVAVIIGSTLFLGPNEAADPIGTAEDPTTTLASETTAPPETTVPSDTSVPESPVFPAGFDPTTVNADGLAGAELRWHPLDVIAADLALTAGIENAGTPEERTAEQAASDFVTVQLDLPAPVLRESTVAVPAQISTLDGTITVFDVMQFTESGETSTQIAFTMVLAQEASSAWMVTHVFTDSFRVDRVEANTSEWLRVTGSGNAFESTGVLNVGLDDMIIAVGNGELGDFSVVVPRLEGDAPVQVLLRADSAADGQFPNVATYMTWPVAASTTLSVFGVAEDDVLNVRFGAGTSYDIVGTLSPDATGILEIGHTELVDGERWLKIDANGTQGWVNRRFLVVDRDLSYPAGLVDQMQDSILTSLRDLDPAVLATTVDIGGIGVYADWPTPWTAIDRDELDVVRNWSPDGTEDRSCECDMGVEQFLGFDTAKWDLAEYRVPGEGPSDDNWGWSHGLSPEFFERYTTGSISIPEPNPQESLDWRRYTVVFDFENGNPVVRGIWRWGWTP